MRGKIEKSIAKAVMKKSEIKGMKKKSGGEGRF